MESKSSKTLTEEELLNLAKEELLRDTKLASIRAELFGAHRWAKPKIPTTNKHFLKYMILSGKSDRKRREKKSDNEDRIREKVDKHSSDSNQVSTSENSKHREETRSSYSSDDKKYHHKKRHSDDNESSHKKHKKSNVHR